MLNRAPISAFALGRAGSRSTAHPMAIEAVLEAPDEFRQANAQCFGPAPELDDVNAAYAALAFADEGLVLADKAAKLDLAHADVLARGAKLGEKVFVFAGVQRFRHRRRSSGGRKAQCEDRICENRIQEGVIRRAR